jgi:hypothetical protein
MSLALAAAALALAATGFAPTVAPPRRRTALRVRNLDQPELLLFSEAVWLNDEGTGVRGGCDTLFASAVQYGTAVACYSSTRGTAALREALSPVPEQLHVAGDVDCATPAALSALRRSLEVQPQAFGGAGGFGGASTPHRRAPLAARCVAFDDTAAGLGAARRGCAPSESARPRAGRGRRCSTTTRT